MWKKNNNKTHLDGYVNLFFYVYSIFKTGIKDFASDTFLRGRNFYFHQSCANVMSSYRLNKELQQQQQQQQQQHQQTEVGSSEKPQTPQNQHQQVDNSNMNPQNDS